MKVAVMQPYFLPYLGYFQLVNAVDKFVFFDDVNFIKKGWINRNQILQNTGTYKFVIPLIKASQNRLINEIEISDYKAWREEFLKIVSFNYKKSPYFEMIYKWLSELLHGKEYLKISDLAVESVKSVAGLLGFSTQFLLSSELNYKGTNIVDGEGKILAICKLFNAKTYVNPKNGVELYDKSKFDMVGIDLKFILMQEITYKQNKTDNFVPYLSILDVLMFNGIRDIKLMLDKYSLV